MKTTTRQTSLGAPALFLGLAVVALGCSKGSPEGERVEASSQAAAPIEGELEGAATPPAPPEKEAEDAWRGQTLEELCKDWKGAYYPPEGHMPSDTPGPEIPSPGIACGYRPVGWDGSRRLFDDLSEEERERHMEVFHRAYELVGSRSDKTPSEAIEILKREYTFEHIGRGELYSFGTIHFTLPGGAPIIVQPGLGRLHPGDRDKPADPKRAPMFAFCVGWTSIEWPIPGTSPMDFAPPEFFDYRFPCKLTRHEPELADLDPAIRRKQEAIEARGEYLLKVEKLTTVETAAKLREEFDGLEYLFTDAVRVSSINFKLRGGTTSFIMPSR